MLTKVLNVSPPYVGGSSGVVLPAQFNTAVERKESDSNIIDAVVPVVLLLPLHCWVTAFPTVGAWALCLVWRLPHYGRGRKLDSELADDVFEVRLLPPSSGLPLLFLPVLLELSSLTEQSFGATAYYIPERCPVPVGVLEF